MQTNPLHIELPEWLQSFPFSNSYSDIDSRVSLVLSLVDANIRHQTGGPFAAALFDTISGELISAATNRVITGHCSIAHAEMLTLALAQQALGTHDLSKHGQFQLVSSSEPCAMCFGALPWSGISELVFSASKADVEAIGFDEGDKAENWIQSLEARGIVITAGIQQQVAAEQLQSYAKLQQPLY